MFYRVTKKVTNIKTVYIFFYCEKLLWTVVNKVGIKILKKQEKVCFIDNNTFENCANTMINWSESILNSFDTPYTNGFIEGCNKIKVLKINAYGFKNFEIFRNRILHIFNYKKENTYEIL